MSNLYIDKKYLLLISSHLRNFRQKNDELWNFSCPFCGDSQKNALKARGYVYRNENALSFKCWNCGFATPFTQMLRHVDNAGITWKEYCREQFYPKTPQQKFIDVPSTNVAEKLIEHRTITLLKFDALPSINMLSEFHVARDYIINRQIPFQFHSEIFYAENFKTFIDWMIPEHGKTLKEEPRIITFYTDVDGTITHVCGRAFQGDVRLRYLTLKVRGFRKVFGAHRADFDRPLYVTEGQFDSLFLPNCVASGDSGLAGVAKSLGIKSPILVYDREPRNKALCKIINDVCDRQCYQVCLLPDSFPGKDINDAVLKGISIEEVLKIVQKNTFEGLTLKLKFNQWRKC